MLSSFSDPVEKWRLAHRRAPLALSAVMACGQLVRAVDILHMLVAVRAFSSTLAPERSRPVGFYPPPWMKKTMSMTLACG